MSCIARKVLQIVCYFGVRPVVTLDSKVRLKDSGAVHDGCKLYNMSL